MNAMSTEIQTSDWGQRRTRASQQNSGTIAFKRRRHVLFSSLNSQRMLGEWIEVDMHTSMKYLLLTRFLLVRGLLLKSLEIFAKEKSSYVSSPESSHLAGDYRKVPGDEVRCVLWQYVDFYHVHRPATASSSFLSVFPASRSLYIR